MNRPFRNSTIHPIWLKRVLFAPCVLSLLGSGLSCKQGAQAASDRPAPFVNAAPIASSDCAQDLVLSGTLEPERSWSLSFATMGTVERVLVREGEAVKRGQPLASLNDRAFRDALGIASSKASQAEDAHRRLQPMYKNSTLPEIKMVEVESAREQARLAVSMAQKSVSDAVLRAPESGWIVKRQAEPGMNMAPGVPAFTLVQTKTMLATAPLPEKQVARVKTGDHATVYVKALERSLEGQVTKIGMVADILTRTYQVEVAIASDDALRIGMLAEVRLTQPQTRPALVIPTESMRVTESGLPFVFVVGPDQRLARREVDVLGFLKEGTAVGKGVAAGELVVTSGTPMLADGLQVRVRGTSKAGKP